MQRMPNWTPAPGTPEQAAALLNNDRWNDVTVRARIPRQQASLFKVEFMNIENSGQHIGLIGYGEVGKIFSAGLKDRPGVAAMSVWDLKLANPATQAAELAHAATAGVTAQPSARALCEASDLVISAVTASNTLAVAQEAAQFIRPGTIFLDLNSASPGTKQQCAALIDAAGAHYVEAGVMTSVPPYGIRVPMLLGGAKAAELAPLLEGGGQERGLRAGTCEASASW